MKYVFLMLMTFLFSACGQGLEKSNENTSDADGSSNCYDGGSCKTFVTASNTDGNLGGIAGADNLCDIDPNKPSGGGTYKAMIVDGTARVACTTANCSGGLGEQVDWVLKPSTTYYRADGITEIGITNTLGLFTVPLTNSYSEALGTSEPNNLWLGFVADWTTTGSHCTAWSNTAGGGRRGRRDSTDIQAIAYGSRPCSDIANALLCVEQ